MSQSTSSSKERPNLRLLTKPTWSIGHYTTSHDQTRLRYGNLQTSKQPNQWLVVLNGRTEWIEKYSHIPDELGLDDSWGYLSLDHRGQGFSEGKFAHIDHYDTFVNDLQEIIKDQIPPSQSYSILAHSMGALIALYGTLKGRLSPKSLILSSPLLLLPNHPIRRRIAEPLALTLAHSPWAKSYTPVGSHEGVDFHNNPLTHSFQLFSDMVKSPHKPKPPTFQWVSATAQATHYVWSSSAIQRLGTPTLIMCGGDESVVDPDGFSLWAQRCASETETPVSFVRIPKARHELLYEIPRHRHVALRHCRNWLKSYHE